MILDAIGNTPLVMVDGIWSSLSTSTLPDQSMRGWRSRGLCGRPGRCPYPGIRLAPHLAMLTGREELLAGLRPGLSTTGRGSWRRLACT